MIVASLFGPFSLEKITLSDRLLGTYSVYSEHEIEVQLAKIRIGNELRGVELFGQFEDCRGCIKIPFCDRFEAGSILLMEKMYTGYTDQDVAYNESIGLLSGNCESKFCPHLPSVNLPEIVGVFYYHYVMPGALKLSAENLDLFHCQMNTLFQRMDKIHFAANCARMIKDTFSSLRDEKRAQFFVGIASRFRSLIHMFY